MHRNASRGLSVRGIRIQGIRIRGIGVERPWRQLPALVATLAATALWMILWSGTAQASAFAQEEPSTASKIWPWLLVMLAVAFVIERVVELVWNYLEWMLLNFTEWTPARLRSANYMQFKSGTSLLIAAVLGILIANLTAMRLFVQLEPLAPSLLAGVSASWDVLVTGLLIGASTKPIHDLVGLLTHFKNYLANNAIKQREMAGAALAEGVLKLAESEAQSLIDVPGVGPTRMDLSSGDGPAEGEEKGSPTDAYIDTLHERTNL